MPCFSFHSPSTYFLNIQGIMCQLCARWTQGTQRGKKYGHYLPEACRHLWRVPPGTQAIVMLQYYVSQSSYIQGTGTLEEICTKDEELAIGMPTHRMCESKRCVRVEDKCWKEVVTSRAKERGWKCWQYQVKACL